MKSNAESLAIAAASSDVMTDVMRNGAERLLAQAIEAEVASWIESHTHLVVDADDHRLVVRNGHMPTRSVITGIGPVPVRRGRIHDRRPADRAIPLEDTLALPSQDQEHGGLIPWLYLKGVSTGAFMEALQALLGPSAVLIVSTFWTFLFVRSAIWTGTGAQLS